MKNSKGRLFGIFNIIDILILIIIAAIIGAGIYIYGNYQRDLDENIKTVEYSIEIKGVDEKLAEAVNNGDLIRESVKGNDLGRVSGKTIIPSTNIYSDFLNGRYVVSEVPDKLDIVLTLTSDAQVTDRSVSVGGLEIRIGQKIYVKGKGYAGEGFIINMNIKE